MEGVEVMVNGGISNGGCEGMVNGGVSNGGGGVSCKKGLEIGYGENGLVRGVVAEEKVEENLAEEVLEDLEEYWEDISDRLMISRMVSDSIIKGMVSAVEQEAAEKISAKELEVADLKKCLLSHEAQKAYEAGKLESFYGRAGAYDKHEKMREDLNVLRDLAREQFKKVKMETEFVRVSNSLKKMGSESGLVGLGAILHKQQSGSWMNLNKMLDSLKTTEDTVCRKVDDDLDLLETLEDSVLQTVVGSLQEEFEEDLLEQNVQFFEIRNMNWLEKFNDISSLGPKLDAIMKSLSMCETELVSHGSHDLEHLHHKALHGENGMLDESNVHVSGCYEFKPLQHMNNQELVDHFNGIISKLKRDHESALHRKTEEYFRLKREYLKVKGTFMQQWKEEEFDVLKKKIPEVIFKLEDFLSKNEKFPALTNNLESMEKLKHRLEALLSENCDLRGRLIHKENEVKCLKSQLSGAAAELLQRSSAEENMMKLVENLKSAEEESFIVASLNEDIHRCALREQITQTRCESEYSNMDFQLAPEIHDVIIREADVPAETANVYELEDSEIKSAIMQELNELLLTEGIRDARRQLEGLCQKVLSDEEMINCLETKVLEKENELRLEVYEKEKLKQEILDLRTTVEQKEKFAMDLSILLSKGREQFDLASQELTGLREYTSQQHKLVAESNKEIASLRSQHLEALEQIEILNQKLDQSIAKAKGERDEALTLAQEMRDKLLVSEAREQTLKKEMEMATKGLSNFFDDFECRVSGAIKSNNLRLESTSFHLQALTKMSYVLKRTELMYKNKLEQRYTDLQKAEAEVDLLGDEVDSLLRLLEKIYIALDHYSPVLKHYPGIMEILELVRRELTGESTFRP